MDAFFVLFIFFMFTQKSTFFLAVMFFRLCLKIFLLTIIVSSGLPVRKTGLYLHAMPSGFREADV